MKNAGWKSVYINWSKNCDALWCFDRGKHYNLSFLKSSSVKKIVKSCTQSQMKTFSYSSFKSRILHTSEAFAIWGWWVGAGLQTPQQKRSRSNSPLILIPQLLLLLLFSIFCVFLPVSVLFSLFWPFPCPTYFHSSVPSSSNTFSHSSPHTISLTWSIWKYCCFS